MTLQERLPPGKYRLTVEDYMRLDDAGIFGTERTELLDGDIIIMNAEYRPHSWVRDELWYRLRRTLEQINSEFTATSGSVRATDHDMPLPDIVLTNEPRGDGPIPLSSVALIVEIASTTLTRDLAKKAALYAGTGVPEYWVADLGGDLLHQLWSPEGNEYLKRASVSLGGSIAAATIAGLVVVLPSQRST